MSIEEEQNPVRAAVSKSKTALWSVGLFSCAVNILMLTGPLFMLQVYDRVLTSRSIPTLVALFALVAALYLFLGLFDFIRSRVLSRIGYRLDVELMALAKKTWIFLGLTAGRAMARPINDLASIRQFMCSNGLPALFDLPWVPVYLAIVYLLHVYLGLLATAGAIIVITATIISEFVTKKPIEEASGWELRDMNFSERSNRNAEAIIAMGMVSNITNYWEQIRHKALGLSQTAGGRSEFITALTKATRMLVQSSMLALGAYLAIFQEISPGTMIAASILGGRALAPVDAAVGSWKNFVRARQAYGRLTSMLQNDGAREAPVQLPEPKGNIEVENMSKLSSSNPATRDAKPILQGLHFKLQPGDGLGVIGPSASGKSSLARLLVGLWMPDKGSVRFEGATYDQWDRDLVGRHIGYLPQSVELIAGTVAQNIARFEPEAKDEDIVAAAKLAGVHELILKLPDGYSADLASGQVVLSGGQSQRIALARAVYGLPSLVVLDEPNASLDVEGDAALTNAIVELRKQGSTVVVMAHRPSAIAAVNKVLMLNNGNQIEFGEKNEVLAKVTQQSKPAPDLRAVE